MGKPKHLPWTVLSLGLLCAFRGEINKWLFTSDTTLSTDQRKELHWRLAWEQWVNWRYLHEQYVSVHTTEANVSVGNYL